jgi:solute carrier family 25 carnitine/acylcarnitine transporter 20/29
LYTSTAVQVYHVHPVKVRFQNPETAQKYGSTLHAIATIIREEKFIGLYKGVTSLLVRRPSPYSNKTPSISTSQFTIGFWNGLVFSSYRFFVKLQLDNPDAIPTLAQVTLAGVGSGIISSCVPCF